MNDLFTKKTFLYIFFGGGGVSYFDHLLMALDWSIATIPFWVRLPWL